MAGRRCHDLEETECLLPFLGSGPVPNPRGSGFYTVEDYRRILEYAAQRHIQVGHCWCSCWLDDDGKVQNRWCRYWSDRGKATDYSSILKYAAQEHI